MLLFFIQFSIYLSYLFCPAASIPMFHLKYFLERPMEMIGDISYLLV